jgi:hypothetical protein
VTFERQIFDPSSISKSDCEMFVWVWNLVSYIKGRLQIDDFENRVLRRIWTQKSGSNTNLGELNNLYSSPNIIRNIKSGR